MHTLYLRLVITHDGGTHALRTLAQRRPAVDGLEIILFAFAIYQIHPYPIYPCHPANQHLPRHTREHLSDDVTAYPCPF